MVGAIAALATTSAAAIAIAIISLAIATLIIIPPVLCVRILQALLLGAIEPFGKS